MRLLLPENDDVHVTCDHEPKLCVQFIDEADAVTTMLLSPSVGTDIGKANAIAITMMMDKTLADKFLFITSSLKIQLLCFILAYTGTYCQQRCEF